MAYMPPPSAVKSERLGHQDRRVLRIAGVAEIDALQRGVLLDELGRAAVSRHPGMVAGVEIDCGDASPWRLGQGQSLRARHF